MEESGSFSLVLFSGTDDKLNAAAVLVAGAAAMGRKVNVLLQYWALDAFRADHVHKDHGVVAEAPADGAQIVQRHAGQHWSDTFRQAKDLGEVSIQACSQSMEMFGLKVEELDPMVDGQKGVAAFFLGADGPVTFI